MDASNPPTDFTAIFNGVPQPYLVLDHALTIVAATDAYLVVTDRTREDIVGRHILEAFPENPDEADTVEQGPLEVSLRHVLRTGKPHEMAVIQYDIPRPESEGGGFYQRFWTPVHTPVLGDDGKVRYIIQNPMDVTESVRKDREADARLRIALHAADLGTWEYEPETDMWRRSAAVDRMFGFEPGQGGSVAAPFFARMHPDDLPAVKASVDAALQSPDQTVIRFDYRIVDTDGTVRHIASRGEVLRTSQGKSRMIGVMMDVSTERMREAALSDALTVQRDLVEQKVLLLAEVNHRVKNSLQLVVSALSLQSRRLRDEGARGAFEQAISRVRAITSVHERLYKSDNPLVVDMPTYLKGLSADLVDDKYAQVHLVVDIDDVELRTERAIPLALIVNELVTNALKYAYPNGEAGQIRLSLKRVGDDMLELTVADKGVGVAGATGVEGLGSRLIATMVTQLQGRLEKPPTDKGYRATVTFPSRSE